MLAAGRWALPHPSDPHRGRKEDPEAQRGAILPPRVTLLPHGPDLWTTGVSYIFNLMAWLFLTSFYYHKWKLVSLVIGRKWQQEIRQNQSRVNKFSLLLLPAEGMEFEACCLFKGEDSRGSRAWLMLPSREPSLYFEAFQRLGGKIEKNFVTLCSGFNIVSEFHLQSRSQPTFLRCFF